MNLKELLQHFKHKLNGIYDQDEVAAIFDLLLEHVWGFNTRQLMLKGISTSVQDEFSMLNYLTELKTGKPVQYVIGETTFYGLRFLVNPEVLIPRPETEELVEWVIQSCMGKSAIRIIDMGTGSGCISIALKKNLLITELTGVDVSTAALATARTNASLNDVQVNFVEADILAGSVVGDRTTTLNNGKKYDVIVSNPPYITQGEKKTMHQNVLDHEPHLALFVSEDRPLIFYEAIADFAKGHLTRNGWLFFEINEHLGEETMQMLRDKSFENIELRKDMQGKDRMIRCSLKFNFLGEM
ncbi:MAG: peptide chain release factor N(5)-glutamine methyltransferase [Chitinophagaceae bacterium]|nr:MAG: peptide chain release factor N(5)-glutamine methyltransferase [Chitinophagaceae bacterium]